MVMTIMGTTLHIPSSHREGVNFSKLRKNDKFELDMMMLIKVTMVIMVTNFLCTLQLFGYLGDVGHFMKMFKSFAFFLFQHFG